MLPLRLKHSYHDGHTGWKIDVHIDDAFVTVKHTKGETSYGETKFNFEWNLIYKINIMTEEISDIQIVIDNIEFINYPSQLQQDFYAFVDKINEDAHF